MSTSTRLTIPMGDDQRRQLKRRAQDLGFDSSQALLRYVSKAIIDGREVTFGGQISYWPSVPADLLATWQSDTKELEADLKSGKAKTYSNVDDMMKDLLPSETD